MSAKSVLVPGIILGVTRLRERTTGLEGTAMVAAEYSTGCVHIGIQPNGMKKDKLEPEDWFWTDQSRFDVLGDPQQDGDGKTFTPVVRSLDNLVPETKETGTSGPAPAGPSI